jgi:hypothetical protein
VLPPTSPALLDPAARPYFLWWTDLTIRDLHAKLGGADADERAYYLGALLREANTRDVWLFTTPDEIRLAWPALLRHLGRARAMWAYLLDLPDAWPPVDARGA